MSKRRVLILYDYFDPAYKAGGPIRSLVNLVQLMEEAGDFYVLTSNKDHDGTILNVTTDHWMPYGKSAKVFYLSHGKKALFSMKKIMAELKPDVVYINGIFSIPFVVFPLRYLRQRKDIKTIIAPRGMLQSESLAIKPWKKKAFLFFLKKLFLKRPILWHVTTAQERYDLDEKIHGIESMLLGNVPTYHKNVILKNHSNRAKKVFGTIALISPMKNFHLTIKALALVNEEVEYHLFGPIKEAKYWEECKLLIEVLPKNINVKYMGEITPESVPKAVQQFDFYIQPSKSENFGHSIFEAFNQGIPVIISDQTPWRNLQQKNAGWDVDLRDHSALKDAILAAIEMENATYQSYRKGARDMAENYMAENEFFMDYKRLFGL